MLAHGWPCRKVKWRRRCESSVLAGVDDAGLEPATSALSRRTHPSNRVHRSPRLAITSLRSTTIGRATPGRERTAVDIDVLAHGWPGKGAAMQPSAGLDGPSRTIIVEPAEQPAIAPPREEPAPEREPPREPVREPERVPA